MRNIPKTTIEDLREHKKHFIDELIMSGEYFDVCGFLSAAMNNAINDLYGESPKSEGE